MAFRRKKFRKGKSRIKRKRTFKRRVTRFKRRRFNPKTILPANSRLVRMKWVSSLSLDPLATGFVSQAYRANDILDPDGSSTSHQPMGFDFAAQQFRTFTVVGSKITLSGAMIQTTVASAGLYGILLQNDLSPVATSPYTLIEQGKCPWRQIQTITNGNVPSRLRHKYSLKKWRNFQSVRDNLQAENSGAFTSSGVTAASPTFLTHFVVFSASLDQMGSDPTAMKFMVIIDYLVLLTDPVETATS